MKHALINISTIDENSVQLQAKEARYLWVLYKTNTKKKLEEAYTRDRQPFISKEPIWVPLKTNHRGLEPNISSEVGT